MSNSTSVVMLPEEERFREMARQREDAAWEEFHGDECASAVPGYGLPYADLHPFDFRPDLECCTVEERQRWVDACLAAERGDTFERGNHSHLFTPDGRMVIGGTQTNWGIGTYVQRYNEDAR